MRFLYMPPGDIHPSYHTAIWLEDESGKLVKTLMVSMELSATEYKLGTVCPDWVKKADWDHMERPQVDAVTGPTPMVGGETLAFDLGKLEIEPGTYQFRYQVHFVDEYNVLFSGKLIVGESSEQVELKKVYLPTQLDAPEMVRDVSVRYYPKAVQREALD